MDGWMDGLASEGRGLESEEMGAMGVMEYYGGEEEGVFLFYTVKHGWEFEKILFDKKKEKKKPN